MDESASHSPVETSVTSLATTLRCGFLHSRLTVSCKVNVEIVELPNERTKKSETATLVGDGKGLNMKETVSAFTFSKHVF
jgi:hypothetical protein